MIETIRVRTSNISGERIPEGKGYTLRLERGGKRYRADLTDKELAELIKWSKAEEVKSRRKKAGSATRRRKKNGPQARRTTRRRSQAAAPQVNDTSANA